jgi:hypothetical protein
LPIEVRSLAEWEAAGIRGMLSVVIPAHNEEGHIAEPVQSLGAALRPRQIVGRQFDLPDRHRVVFASYQQREFVDRNQAGKQNGASGRLYARLPLLGLKRTLFSSFRCFAEPDVLLPQTAGGLPRRWVLGALI